MEHSEIDSGPACPNRITCFIDMLGFTRDVLDLELLERRLHILLPMDAMLQHIANCKHNIEQPRAESRCRYDGRMMHLSDCIVLSYRAEPNAICFERGRRASA